MASAGIVAEQVAILFLLIGLGFLSVKTGLIGEKGASDLTKLLLYLIMPPVVLNLFSVPIDSADLTPLLIALAGGAFCHAVSMLSARLFFGRKPEESRVVLSNAVVLSNSSFMAIPLLNALIGAKGTLYLAPYLIWFNLISWTYGFMTMNREKKSFSPRLILLNPTILAVAAAVILVISGITLPTTAKSVISMLASVNSPLAMILIGAQIALTKPKFRPSKDVLLAALLRNIVVPLIALALLLIITKDRTLLLAALIPAAAPTAATVVLFSTRFSRDIRLASETMTFSTLVSIITLPAMALLAESLLSLT